MTAVSLFEWTCSSYWAVNTGEEKEAGTWDEGRVKGENEGEEAREEGPSVTELIELSVHSGRTGDRTDQPGFQEGGPPVDQAPLPAYVILDGWREERDGGMGDEDRVEDDERKTKRRHKKSTTFLPHYRLNINIKNINDCQVLIWGVSTSLLQYISIYLYYTHSFHCTKIMWSTVNLQIKILHIKPMKSFWSRRRLRLIK